ncbi:MAG: HEAT repeat domain-containing protein [Planctomycetia bacterium]|nr:HEAT repeat domain-containing protein [Planctomycetia bacterium]
MKRTVQAGLISALVSLYFLKPAAADEVESIVKTLRVPAGFTVELVAAAPLVHHPIMAGFDDRGRLFVADNAGLNLPAEELLKQLPNMIRMLEDTDGDGRFDRSTLFADKMTFPQGAAWFRGALYVASPPSIWRLEDTDGDGVADRREEIVQKFGFTGNAADIHGCFITPTGRIAWCDGRHGHEFKGDKGQMPSKGLAARVFSCRPDGSDVEVFCGGGMDNPVEVAFTPEGDVIGTMTFYNPDDARHDALVHFVHGGVYPRKHPCTSEFKRTGDFLPALSRFGAVAPSGLTRYSSATWGEEFRDNLYSTQFNTHKIVRHVLSRQGATYSSADEDFLVSTNADFHPTDVLEDADGSLLVIDTGGWFHIGCPTSQIAKPQIGGGIYRIRRAGVAPVADPRGLQTDWAQASDIELAERLGDERPAVAERTLELLAARGDPAMGSLATAMFESTSYRARENAVWALARNGSDNARRLLRQALSDDDAPVRQAAVHSVSDLRDAESLPALLEILQKDEPAVRREAATALGRIGKAGAVPALLESLGKPADRFVEHALIYALIEINDRPATLAGLADPRPAVRRGALIALDQMYRGQLTREIVAPLLSTDDENLMRALVEILAKHPDWADELTSLVAGWLSEASPSAEQLATVRGAISALIQRPAVQNLVVGPLESDTTDRQIRLMLLEVIAAGEYAKMPANWRDALGKNLASNDGEILRQAIATVAALDVRPFTARLMDIGIDGQRPADVRIAALCAAAKNSPSLPEAGFEFLSSQLENEGPLRDRLAAAEALGGMALSAPQLEAAARLAAHCGPLEISWLVRAFAHDTNARTGRLLIDSLSRSPALASLPAERLREAFKNYPGEVQLALQPLIDRLAGDDQERAAKMKSLEKSTGSGDSAQGENVFFGTRAACAACHRIGGRGEKIGPDLSKIGEVRNHRDLLEAILFPSASLARGYESFHVVTKSGQVHSGLLSREASAAIYLRTTERIEVRVDRSDIEELSPSQTSIMPQGMEKILSPRELADVVAYLQSLK